jgi:low affinity Fe/Cu permease
MKTIYQQIEIRFEKLTSIATNILGNPVTFIVALCLVIFWLTEKAFYKQSLHACIGDIILSVTFLSLFIIQKSFNRFSGSLHLKVNELVASHEPASNAVIGAENKTEYEIAELMREHDELIDLVKKEKEEGTDQ